jgi:hypothetical protein
LGNSSFYLTGNLFSGVPDFVVGMKAIFDDFLYWKWKFFEMGLNVILVVPVDLALEAF